MTVDPSNQSASVPDSLPLDSNLTHNVLTAHSLLGEPARKTLFALTLILLGWFVYCTLFLIAQILPLIAASILLIALITSRGGSVLRMLILVAMTINVFALVTNPNETFGLQTKPPTEIPTWILLLSLAVTSICEIVVWVKSSSRETLIKTFCWGLLTTPLIIYSLGIPLASLAIESIWKDDSKLVAKDPNWNWWNEATFRAAKFFVFAAFTYLGACVGSFLNVVAYCIPRGESVGLRDSKCPKCNSKITRIDNLPIFSFVNLGGRCRNCECVIPIRYLLVEVIAATIFGSLFLYELVTGCTNIPVMRISYKSILWIILYPKWNAIGIYFFHALFMCMLMTLALIEWDKQRLTRGFTIFLFASFFSVAAIFPVLQPVPIFDHLDFISFELAPMIDRFLKLLVGGIIGWIVGTGFSRLAPTSSGILPIAFGLTGLVLGWQGLLQVTLVFGMLLAIVRFLPVLRIFVKQPTAVLFAAVMIHHPFWRIISDLW